MQIEENEDDYHTIYPGAINGYNLLQNNKKENILDGSDEYFNQNY